MPTFADGALELYIADATITSNSNISVTFTHPSGEQTGAGLVHWVDLNPGVGFTIHLGSACHGATNFTYIDTSQGGGGGSSNWTRLGGDIYPKVLGDNLIIKTSGGIDSFGVVANSGDIYSEGELFVTEKINVYPTAGPALTVIDMSEKLDPTYTYGSNILVDPGYESWKMYDKPEDWMLNAYIDYTYIPTQTTDRYSGTYAVKLNGAIGHSSGLSTDSDDLDSGSEYITSFYAKSPGAHNLHLYFNYYSGMSYSYWNFTGVNAGTWTVGGMNPSADQLLTFILTPAYTLYTAGVPYPTKPGTSTRFRVNFYSEYNDVYLDLVKLLENGGSSETPGYWEDMDPSFAVTKSTDAHTGSFSVKFNGDGVDFSGVGQFFDSLTPGDTYTTSFYSKATTSGDTFLIYLTEIGGTDYIWNFTGGNAGTWTVSGGFPSGHQIFISSVTTSWVQYTTTGAQVIIPASGEFILISGSLDPNIFLDDITCKKDGTGVDIVLNGGFEDWGIKDYVYNGDFEDWEESFQWPNALTAGWQSWCTQPGGFSNDSYYAVEETIVHSGTYAIKLQTAGSTYGFSTTQRMTGLTTGNEYLAKIWSRNSAGNAAFAYFNNTPSTATQVYNFNTQAWDAYGGGVLGVNNQSNFTLSGTYTQYTAPMVTVPLSGMLTLAILPTGVSSTIYVDDASLQQRVLVPAASVIPLDISNPSDATKFAAGDYIFRLRTTGGTPVTYLQVDTDGTTTFLGDITTDDTYLNFIKPIYVSTNRGIGYALNNQTGISVLSGVTGINAKVAGSTSLYTVPAGRSLIIDRIALTITNSTGTTYSVSPQFDIGCNSPSYDDYCAVQTPTTSTNNTMCFVPQTEGGTMTSFDNAMFSDWIIDPLKPDHWDCYAPGTSTITKETGDTHSPPNAVRFTSGAGPAMVGQGILQVTVGRDWYASIYAKKDIASSANARLFIIGLNDVVASATQIWNRVTATWDVFTPGVTPINSTYGKECAITTIWTQYSSSMPNHTTQTPVIGNLYFYFYATGTAGDIILIDDAFLFKTTYGSYPQKVYQAGQEVKLTITRPATTIMVQPVSFNVYTTGFLI